MGLKLLSANLACNWVSPLMSREGETAQTQLDALAAREADIYLCQEMTTPHLSEFGARLGGNMAFHAIRLFEKPLVHQALAIFSRYEIRDIRGKNLLPLHIDGKEITPQHAEIGMPVQSAVLAALIETPLGSVWAVTYHGAWTRRAHEGLEAHQQTALRGLRDFVTSLPGPVVLGADFNTMMKWVQQYLPMGWKGTTPADFDGTSLNLTNPATMATLRENKVVVDGMFVSPPLRVNRPLIHSCSSDHVWIEAQVQAR